MAPVYRIRNPDATYTDISAYFRLYKLDVATNAEEGSVAQSTITAHDPDGTFDIVGHRQLRIHEDTATGSNTMIYVGFTGDRRISRGPNRTTVGADWEIDLLDPNSILARRILTGSDSNRPAETDVARIQWLVSTNESGMVNDSLYVQTAGPVNMDAKDYTGQRFNEVIDDCAQASGKNYHLWYRETTGTFSLWYDFDSSTSQTSPLRLTNVASEVDSSLTFEISQDTQLTRSPDRVNSGIYLPFDGTGSPVYVQNGTTSNSFARRDVVMPAENVTTLTKATARANRYLTEMSSEEDVITTTVIVPAAKQGFLKEGMRVQFKATHLPGYENYGWVRAMNRSVNQISEEYYALKMELSPIAAAAGLEQSIAAVVTNSSGLVLPNEPTPGHVVFLWKTRPAGSPATYPVLQTGFTQITTTEYGSSGGIADRNVGSLQYRVVQTGDTAASLTGSDMGEGAASVYYAISEWIGTYSGVFATLNNRTSSTPFLCGGSITPSAGSKVIGFANIWQGSDEPTIVSLVPASGTTELTRVGPTRFPWNWVGYKSVETAAATTVGGTVTGTDSRVIAYAGVTVVIS